MSVINKNDILWVLDGEIASAQNANRPLKQTINLINDLFENTLGDITNAVTPTGAMTIFAGTTIPTGYLICNGQEVNRTLYSRLFGVVGFTYGEGNGTNTFNIPNLQQGSFSYIIKT